MTEKKIRKLNYSIDLLIPSIILLCNLRLSQHTTINPSEHSLMKNTRKPKRKNINSKYKNHWRYSKTWIESQAWKMIIKMNQISVWNIFWLALGVFVNCNKFHFIAANEWHRINRSKLVHLNESFATHKKFKLHLNLPCNLNKIHMSQVKKTFAKTFQIYNFIQLNLLFYVSFLVQNKITTCESILINSRRQPTRNSNF